MANETIFPILREIRGITRATELVRIETEYGELVDEGMFEDIPEEHDEWEVREMYIEYNVLAIVVHIPDEE